MGKKYLETKRDSLESSILGVWQNAAVEEEQRHDGRTKQYKEHRAKLEAARKTRAEKLVGGQKKLDKDKDGDIDGKDFALLRKAKKEEVEFKRYHETKQGSLRESILKMWGEVNEKVEYVEYKFKNERDAKAAKSYFDGIQIMSFDVNDDNIRGGELMVDAGSKDMTKYHKEVMKKFRPKVMTQEKKDLTKEKKDDTKKMTDTGKEVTPVETSVKMPKIKETKNKV